MDVHDSRDGEDLYRVLRDEVIPLYYQRDRDGCRAAGSSA
jgi:glycogen phosphorylase